MPSSLSLHVCPTCSHQFPVHPNELPWCDKCEWNLEGDIGKDIKLSRFDKIQLSIGKKLTKKLFADLSDRKIDRPRMTLSKVIVYAFATLVHLATLSLPVLAVFAFLNFHYFIASILSIPLVLLFWKILPKPRKWQKEVASREKFPTLYKVADEVARKMNTTEPTAIEVISHFNAYYTEYGMGPWKKKVITLGHPLLSLLSDEEVIAIISHETSHGANGDIARGFYVGAALDALANWFYALNPWSIHEGDMGVRGGAIATWVANICGWLLAQIPLKAYHVSLQLLFRQKQEAEYLADRLASEVCGTKAMISALEKLDQGSYLAMAVQKAALTKNTNADVFGLTRELAATPRSAREKERRSRIEIKWGLSLDTTHPPTPYRISFISKETYLPQVRLSEAESKQLRAELDSLTGKVSRELIDGYLDSLYYGGSR